MESEWVYLRPRERKLLPMTLSLILNTDWIEPIHHPISNQMSPHNPDIDMHHFQDSSEFRGKYRSCATILTDRV